MTTLANRRQNQTDRASKKKAQRITGMLSAGSRKAIKQAQLLEEIKTERNGPHSRR